MEALASFLAVKFPISACTVCESGTYSLQSNKIQGLKKKKKPLVPSLSAHGKDGTPGAASPAGLLAALDRLSGDPLRGAPVLLTHVSLAPLRAPKCRPTLDATPGGRGERVFLFAGTGITSWRVSADVGK